MSKHLGYKEMIRWRLDMIEDNVRLIRKLEKSTLGLKKEIKEIEKKYLESLEVLIDKNTLV